MKGTAIIFKRNEIAVPYRVWQFFLRSDFMISRVGIVSIVVEKGTSTLELNEILHSYSDYIIGRMGVPYTKKEINLISIAMDAPQDVFSSLSGKIGSLCGVSVKTVLSNVVSDE